MLNESPEYLRICSFQTFLYSINQNYFLVRHKQMGHVDKNCTRGLNMPLMNHLKCQAFIATLEVGKMCDGVRFLFYEA